MLYRVNVNLRKLLLMVLSKYLKLSGSLPGNKKVSKDSAKNYGLPELLLLSDGTRITSAKLWWEKRRQEILKLFEHHVYGKAPNRPYEISFSVTSNDKCLFNGLATKKEIEINITRAKNSLKLQLLIYLPNAPIKPIPIFVGLNYFGNHTVHNDPQITLSPQWFPNNKKFGVKKNLATEASRGTQSYQWPIERILERGYGLATCYYGDIDPDYNDGFKNGVHPVFYEQGQTRPSADEWGSISAWAWGLSRIADYLETDADVDQKRMAVTGFSRLGKTAMWAGVLDQRFSLVVSVTSGCGGAKLFKRHFGETTKNINKTFPHWFCENFKKYNDRENELPVDQHMLVALIAPRPIYIISAQEDLWTDPIGAFLSAKLAEPVYLLLGTEGMATEEMPQVNQPLLSTIGYHLRKGKHEITDDDWERIMDFADIHLSE